MGGLTGGLFAFFEWIGLVFFSVLIGGRRASRASLRTNRVIAGGSLLGLLASAVISTVAVSPVQLFVSNIANWLILGLGGGLLLALVLLVYVHRLEREERQIEEARAWEQERVRDEQDRAERLEREKQEEIQRLKRVAELRAREKSRIKKAEKAGITLDPKDEERRAKFVEEGVDPDDPDAVAEATAMRSSRFRQTAPIAGGGCVLFVVGGIAAVFEILRWILS